MPYDVSIMPTPNDQINRVRECRTAAGLTQAELAERADISRTAVTAIEGGRLVPSVAAALALARTLGCSVEELFGTPLQQWQPAWAWTPGRTPSRYWLAEVSGAVRAFPVESTPRGEMAHDGVAADSSDSAVDRLSGSSIEPRDTLVMAGCDPAVSLLARHYENNSRFRMLTLQRSSRKALDLLARGLVHVAGIHLSPATQSDGNSRVVAKELGSGYRLLRLADWEEGIAFRDTGQRRSIESLLKPKVRWVAREPGSGARLCMDELFGKPRHFRHSAMDHHSVTAAIQGGWADAGVCPRLVGDEAGLSFLSVRWETYDLCYSAGLEDDPRLRMLLLTVRDLRLRSIFGELPGYDIGRMGELAAT